MAAQAQDARFTLFFIGAVVVAVCAIVGWTIREVRAGDRYVSVKGVAEREVRANLCVWPIKVRVAKDNLEEARQAADQGRRQVLAFLESNAIPPTDVASQRIRVTDRQANEFVREQGTLRYIVEYTILVRSQEVEKLEKVSQMTDKLVAAGVMLSSQGVWDANSPQFVYTQLNTIKPEMMAQATRAAYEVAAQFAQDSGSTLGEIRRASQGVFSVVNRDQVGGPEVGSGEGALASASDPVKKVRVVVSVDYVLH
ncbi:MAG TPA: SIMPL domain-containing protein [Burkholderiaceae bacterium]|nr:SIMPL domain-containing protein [Burkholderiaceae bacterium]HYB51407.1 SIMPL domain-containing protein [Burkholderiaceae bacterium]